LLKGDAASVFSVCCCSSSVLREGVDDSVEVEVLAVMIGCQHVLINHHGDAARLEPRVEPDVGIEKRLGAGLAAEEFVRRLAFLAAAPPLVALRRDVLRLEGLNDVEQAVVDNRIVVGVGDVALVVPALFAQFRMVADCEPPVGMATDLPSRAEVHEVVAAELAEAPQIVQRVSFLRTVELGPPRVAHVGR